MDRRELLTQVFQDTRTFYQENETLIQAVESACQEAMLYEPENYPPLPMEPKQTTRCGRIEVSPRRTFEAAVEVRKKHPNARIAVLNFASATNPGGGVKRGSSAQEECLCRCSTLYPTLDQRRMWDGFYAPNRASRDPLHTDACIYTPGVVICKTDEDIPKRLKQKDFVTVDVITCAAPNLRPSRDGTPVQISQDNLSRLLLRRARHIFHIAAANNVDALVLGAFGCGVFCNDPHMVADAFFTALKEYRRRFDIVEFAIYCRDSRTKNFSAFQERRDAHDFGDVTILPPGERGREAYGEAWGGQSVRLTKRQLRALNAGGQLALNVRDEYVVFLQGPEDEMP